MRGRPADDARRTAIVAKLETIETIDGTPSRGKSIGGDARLQSRGPNLGSTGVIVSFAALKVRKN
jgi:hypothetical protein